MVIRSGVTPPTPWYPAGPRREVITSSKISTIPNSAVSARSMARNSGRAGMQPPEPVIGSISTAASRSLCARINSAVASVSL